MISTIAEHSVDLKLLDERPFILDIGCRGFQFRDELRRLGFYVTSVDIDDFPDRRNDYTQIAITGKNGLVGIKRSDDPQATKVVPGNDVESITIESFTENRIAMGLQNKNFQWGLIKIDVEGSEYDIIMSLSKPPAKQLSIEFHLHTGAYTIFHMNEMENKLADLGYKQVKHEYTNEYGAGLNYWDSLFILK